MHSLSCPETDADCCDIAARQASIVTQPQRRPVTLILQFEDAPEERNPCFQLIVFRIRPKDISRAVSVRFIPTDGGGLSRGELMVTSASTPLPANRLCEYGHVASGAGSGRRGHARVCLHFQGICADDLRRSEGTFMAMSLKKRQRQKPFEKWTCIAYLNQSKSLP
jgi:hypothetical protein